MHDRLAPLGTASTLMTLGRRAAAWAAHAAGWPVTWRADPWHAEGSEDDDPEPDADTLEAHARLVRARRTSVWT